jgi:hypothetical protein
MIEVEKDKAKRDCEQNSNEEEYCLIAGFLVHNIIPLIVNFAMLQTLFSNG